MYTAGPHTKNMVLFQSSFSKYSGTVGKVPLEIPKNYRLTTSFNSFPSRLLFIYRQNLPVLVFGDEDIRHCLSSSFSAKR